VSLLYCAYLAKSALGINLSDRYTAPTVLKIPLKALNYPVTVKKHHRHDRSKTISLEGNTQKLRQNT
jgi:hypothetical protein